MEMTRALIVILSFCLSLSAHAASVTVNGSSGPVTVSPGAAITATVTGGPDNPGDWLGVYAVGVPTPTSDPPSWKWLSTDDMRGTIPPAPGVAAGTVHLVVPTQVGNYEVRFFPNNGWVSSAAGPAMTVGAAPSQPAAPMLTKELTWVAGHDLANIPLGWFPQASTIRAINCRVETPVGAAATLYLVKVSSGAPLAKGTKISGTCDGNAAGTANQNLLTGLMAVNAGDTIGIVTPIANWASGLGKGVVTLGYSVP